MSDQVSQPIAFKAEIRQVLDILIHSLYTDREIFLREMVSNASDALNRMRYEMAVNRDILDPESNLEIRITADKDARTVTISDTGIGMTADEITTNLGTIAQSGAREFLAAAEEQKENLSNIIGQFGVGFYSIFMVAESVTVTSRSFKPDEQAVVWFSEGDSTFTVTPGERETRGTTIEIKLKEDAAEFADEFRVREIIRKHSDYVAFPVFIGEAEEQVNRQTAIWRQAPSDVTDEEYQDFYRHLTLEFEPPQKHIHLSVDAPIQMYALLYIPGGTERNMFSLRKEDGLKLYARKVLIQEYSKDLLPEYFRFIQGVVDAEDLPLNVSRETIQSNTMMARLKKVLTSRVTNTLKQMAKNKSEPEPYIKFWETFGQFIKEGISTDQSGRESLYPLLRFFTTTHTNEWTSLDEYVGRMKPDQKNIFFILGTDKSSVTRSPHLDYFRKHGYEVILLTETIDSFMLLGLQNYEGFDLKNVASPDLELPTPEDTTEQDAEDTPEISGEALDSVIERFKTQLGEQVAEVRTTTRLSNSVARLVDPEGTMNQEMQRVYKLLEKNYEVPKKILEINPKHPIIMHLNSLDPDHPLSAAVMEQIYENALLIEGLLPDPASMIPRIQDLIETALQKAGTRE